MTRIFAPVFLIIISLGLFFSYLKPAWGALQEYQNLKITLAEAIQNYNLLDEKISAIQIKHRAVTASHYENLSQILPDAVNPIRFLVDVDKISKELDLTLLSFVLPHQDRSVAKSIESTANTVKTAEISILLEGEYHDFKEFLKTIESSKTLTDVVSIGIEKKENEAKTGYNLVYNITMKLYWLN